MDEDEYTGLSYKSLDFEVKNVSATGEFEAFGLVYNTVDLGHDVIEKGAAAKSIAQWKTTGRFPPLLFGHDMRDLPLGPLKSVTDKAKGLQIKGQLLMDVQKSREAHALMKAKALTGISIGYRVHDAEFTNAGIRVLKEIEIFEFSVLPLPMNDEARVTAVKSFTSGKVPDKRVLENALRDVGMSQRQSKAFLSGGYDALREVGAGDLESINDALNRIKGVLNGT